MKYERLECIARNLRPDRSLSHPRAFKESDLPSTTVDALRVGYFTLPFIMNHVTSKAPGGSRKNHEVQVFSILAHIRQKEYSRNNLTRENHRKIKTQTRKEKSIGPGRRLFISRILNYVWIHA